MTLEEISLKYSFKEIQSMPGDGDFRRQLFTPFLKDLYENKIVYYERFICIATLEDIKFTPERFEAKAIPYLKIERPDREFRYYPDEPWTFGARWDYMRLLGNHFGTYGMWVFWPEKVLVKTVEELVRKKDFETALDMTAFKEVNAAMKSPKNLPPAPITPIPNVRNGE